MSLFELPDDGPPIIDPSPDAPQRARFQIAHLVKSLSLDTVDMAERCEVSRRTIERWIENGIGSWQDADVFACKVLDLPTVYAFGDQFVPDDDGQESLFDSTL